ncbi:MAG TPA: (5-formylfuran-3-yl)methyl phosphate synthase [Vicinamibacterales bacterium]|jgi:uncharacterized protein (UPF0264 family)|nr:(5-formylfuran-3-yl)methyl phosphate synthase [Vicinamibacterales bacterium]
MQLLVSVRNRHEAAAASAGGASIVDAKDPAAGPLGPVALDEFRAIVDAVHGSRPVSAALGDAVNAQRLEQDARAYASAGATFVKVGFAGIADAGVIQEMVAAAVRGAVPARCQVVGVAYADHQYAVTVSLDRVLQAIVRAGAHGVLVDTADKDGEPLLRLMSAEVLTRSIRTARAAGLMTAMAGRLTLDDIQRVAACGADVVGVRGAACDGGRLGTIRATKVRALVEAAGSGLKTRPYEDRDV